jgi:hypothetical protein
VRPFQSQETLRRDRKCLMRLGWTCTGTGRSGLGARFLAAISKLPSFSCAQAGRWYAPRRQALIRKTTNPHSPSAKVDALARLPEPMKIASFNNNNINRRLVNLLSWLREAQPDIVCLQASPPARRRSDASGTKDGSTTRRLVR